MTSDRKARSLPLVLASNTWVISAIAWSLFAIACACPALKEKGPDPVHSELRADSGPMWGYQALALGVLALAMRWLRLGFVPWLANIFFVAGWILLVRKKLWAALACALIAVPLGALTWAIFPSNETDILIGTYMWEASLVVLALGVLTVYLCGGSPPQRK